MDMRFLLTLPVTFISLLGPVFLKWKFYIGGVTDAVVFPQIHSCKTKHSSPSCSVCWQLEAPSWVPSQETAALSYRELPYPRSRPSPGQQASDAVWCPITKTQTPCLYLGQLWGAPCGVSRGLCCVCITVKLLLAPDPASFTPPQEMSMRVLLRLHLRVCYPESNLQ